MDGVPKPILNKIVLKLNTTDFFNFGLMSNKYFTLCTNEKFLEEKVKHDHPTINLSAYRFDTYTNLYKQIAIGVGRLKNLNTNYMSNDTDIKSIVVQNNSRLSYHYAITGDDKLVVVKNRILHSSMNKLDLYFLQHVYMSVHNRIAKNIKKVIITQYEQLILTTNDHLYRLKRQDMPDEINIMTTDKENYLLVLLAENINDIDGYNKTTYYITNDSDLYVKGYNSNTKTINNESTDYNFVSRIKKAYICHDLYYITEDNILCGIHSSGFEEISQIERTVKQFIVHFNGYYILYSDGNLVIYNWKSEEIASYGDINKIFDDRIRLLEIYIQTYSLELYRYKDDNTTLVGTNIQSIVDDEYIIFIPQINKTD